VIDPEKLAEMAKRPPLITMRDRPHRFVDHPNYADSCAYTPLAMAGECGRKRKHSLHRGG